MVFATNWQNNIGMEVDSDYLNAVGAALNAGTQSGTFASRPAASANNNGMHYLCTDSDAIYRSDGTTWTKIRAGGFAGSLADPPSSGWTAVNLQSGASFAQDADSMLFTVPSVGSSGNYQYEYIAYPGTPFTLTALIDVSTDPAAGTWAHAGITVSDGTKLITFGPGGGIDSAGTASSLLKFVSAVKFATVSTFGSTLGYTDLARFTGFPKWFRLVDNGTNLSWFCSIDGVGWFQIGASESRTAYLGTPTRLGVGATNFSGKTLRARVRSWKIT